MIEAVGIRHWSRARIEAFRRCRRLGTWSYEVAPRGRSPDAPAEARLARALARMTDLPSLVHEVVRDLVVESLAAARTGTPLAFDSEEPLRRLRAAWRDAREHWRGGLRTPPPSPDRHRPVFEVFYGEEGPALRETAKRAPDCVEAWLRSELFAALRDAPSEDLLWLDTVGTDEEDRTALESGGVRVHAAPDLVWRNGGVTEIVEWRTDPGGEDAPDRLAEGGLWTVGMLGADPSALAARVVHLHEGAREDVLAIGEDDLRAAAERIRRDVVELESMHGTAIESLPRLDAVECAACRFKAVCWSEPPDGNGA